MGNRAILTRNRVVTIDFKFKIFRFTFVKVFVVFAVSTRNPRVCGAAVFASCTVSETLPPTTTTLYRSIDIDYFLESHLNFSLLFFSIHGSFILMYIRFRLSPVHSF
uniref:Uncharacterized protein n=1 Tax=Oryza brachyantha TaxID=4533 RepID=J3MWE2_ORYBR